MAPTAALALRSGTPTALAEVAERARWLHGKLVDLGIVLLYAVIALFELVVQKSAVSFVVALHAAALWLRANTKLRKAAKTRELSPPALAVDCPGATAGAADAQARLRSQIRRYLAADADVGGARGRRRHQRDAGRAPLARRCVGDPLVSFAFDADCPAPADARAPRPLPPPVPRSDDCKARVRRDAP